MLKNDVQAEMNKGYLKHSDKSINGISSKSVVVAVI